MEKMEFRNCDICGREMVMITGDTFKSMSNILRPVIKSMTYLDKLLIREKMMICPRCDAYALGIEMERGFPFITSDGRELIIQDIAYSLWG